MIVKFVHVSPFLAKLLFTNNLFLISNERIVYFLFTLKLKVMFNESPTPIVVCFPWLAVSFRFFVKVAIYVLTQLELAVATPPFIVLITFSILTIAALFEISDATFVLCAII